MFILTMRSSMKKIIALALVFCAPALFAASRYTNNDYSEYRKYDNRYGTTKYACCDDEEHSLYGLHTNTTRVEFFGGVAFGPKDWTDNGQTIQIADTGFTAGIAFVRNILPWLTLGLDGNYAGFTKGDDVKDGSDTLNYRSGVATGLVTGRAYLFPHAMTRLYGTAGIGAAYMYTKEKNDTADSKHTYDSTDLAWMLGAGLEFDIDETVVFGLEGRYNWVGLRSDHKAHFGQKDFHYWSAMLKLGVKF